MKNKPGAGGNIGADLITKATLNGHTMSIAAVAAHVIDPWLFSKLPFNPASITQMAHVPNVLVVNTEFAQRRHIATLADLIARQGQPRQAQLRFG